MLENGLDICSCKRTQCERHGDCTACIEHHKMHKRYAPYCIRKKERDLKKAELKLEKEAEKAKHNTERQSRKADHIQDKESEKALE